MEPYCLQLLIFLFIFCQKKLEIIIFSPDGPNSDLVRQSRPGPEPARQPGRAAGQRRPLGRPADVRRLLSKTLRRQLRRSREGSGRHKTLSSSLTAAA